MIEKDSGHAFFIEMNPYAPSELHLGKLVGTDVCGAMARQLGRLTEITETATPRDQRPIALFPRELARDPESTWLRAGSEVLYDVPRDDPEVFETCYNRLLEKHPEHSAKIAGLLGMEERAVGTSDGASASDRSAID